MKIHFQLLCFLLIPEFTSLSLKWRLIRNQKIQKVLTICLFLILPNYLFAQTVINFDDQTGDLTVDYNGQSIINGVIKINYNNDYYPINTAGFTVSFTENSNTSPNGALIHEANFILSGPDSALLYFAGTIQGDDAFPCSPQNGDGNIIRTISGFSQNLLNNGFYSRGEDWAIYFKTVDWVTFEHLSNDSFTLKTSGKEITFNFKPDYYKKHLNRSYFNPGEFSIRNESVAGWISWKAYGPYLTEDDVKHAADWCAVNLKQFGLQYIIIDDGWFVGSNGMLHTIPADVDWTKGNDRFPSGMAALADYIHAKGLKAGIWLSPFGISNTGLMSLHPDWWVRETPGGAYARSQDDWHGPYFVDSTVPDAVREYLLTGINAMMNDGYDFFKIDGQKHVAHEAYQSASSYFLDKGFSWQEAYRHGWQAIMDATQDKFVLSCWSRIPENIGNPHAIRIGSDKDAGWECGPKPAAYDLAKYLLEHNICWIDDPDHLVLSNSDDASARSWVTLVGLTGTLLTFSDKPEQLSSEKVKMLQRILPPLQTRPLELYEMNTSPPLWTLEVDRPYDNWLIVANTSFSGQPKTSITFSELGLQRDKEYTVYNFWDQQFVGTFTNRFDCPPLSNFDVQVYSIHEKKSHPWIASVNRHISQGGVSLIDVNYNQKTNVLSGKSKVVGNDTYKISVYHPENYYVVDATADQGAYFIQHPHINIVDFIIETDQNTDVQWQISFNTN